MSSTEMILNITVNAAAGADPKAIADAIGRAFNRQIEEVVRPVQPMQAVVTNLEPGEALLCSESPARELTQGVHAVSAAINAAGNHLPLECATSLFPHLKALVSELDRQLVPAPTAASAQSPSAEPEQLDHDLVRALGGVSNLVGELRLWAASGEVHAKLVRLAEHVSAVEELLLPLYRRKIGC